MVALERAGERTQAALREPSVGWLPGCAQGAAHARSDVLGQMLEDIALLVDLAAPDDTSTARRPESARVDPDNVEILIQHLACAAFELPSEEGEACRRRARAHGGESLEYLAQHQVVQPVESTSGRKVDHWSTDAYPANAVSLRTVGWDNSVVIDVGERAPDREATELVSSGDRGRCR